jgi:hypothetical protein
MTTGIDCPSEKLGLCKRTCEQCLAQICEKNPVYGEKTLKSRKERANKWNDRSESEIIDEINFVKKYKNITEIRINSSGDFRNQEDINKLYNVLENTKTIGYGWTSRDDLIFKESDYVYIRGSNFDTWCGKSIILNNVKNIPENFTLCPSAGLSKFNSKKKSCYECRLCINNKKINIAFRELKEKN